MRASSQVKRRRLQLFQAAYSAHWNFLLEALACSGVEKFLVHLGHEIARTENVDLNVIAHQFQGHDTGQLNDRGLAGAISQEIAGCDFAEDRGDIDNASTFFVDHVSSDGF